MFRPCPRCPAAVENENENTKDRISSRGKRGTGGAASKPRVVGFVWARSKQKHEEGHTQVFVLSPGTCILSGGVYVPNNACSQMKGRAVAATDSNRQRLLHLNRHASSIQHMSTLPNTNNPLKKKGGFKQMVEHPSSSHPPPTNRETGPSSPPNHTPPTQTRQATDRREVVVLVVHRRRRLDKRNRGPVPLHRHALEAQVRVPGGVWRRQGARPGRLSVNALRLVA